MSDKVLIADDDPAICKLLEKVMRSNDLEPAIAHCGREALDLLKSHTFDIILLDVMLGDMEGFDVIKKIRNQESQYHQLCWWFGFALPGRIAFPPEGGLTNHSFSYWWPLKSGSFLLF